MPRGARLAVVASALVLVLAASTVVPLATANTGVPTWSVGDTWSFAAYGGEVSWEYTSLGSGDTLRLVVLGTETLAIGSVSYPTYHVQAWFNVSGGTPSPIGDVWYRMSDLSVVRWAATLHIYGFAGWSNSSFTATGNPPPGLRFPLAAGANWTSATDVSFERVDLDNGSVEWTNGRGQVNYSVGSDSTVTVPAGAFAVEPITEDLSIAQVLDPMFPYTGPRAVVDFSAAVGNAAEIVNYINVSGSYHELGALALTSYSRTSPGSGPDPVLLGIGAGVVAALAIAALVRIRRRRAARTPPTSSPTPPSQPPTPPPGLGR